jgi:ubiquinone/menaquinone biosynthesis C-methylase UbiE
MSRLFAAIYDPFMRKTEQACLVAWRRELLSGLSGRVLEIGAGTGANVPLYPQAVTSLVLAEPDPHMLARLRPRAPSHAEVLSATGDSLPFPDASFDAVVSTLVLCSVPEPSRSLSELHRVLRPGGTFAFLEHVAATDASSRLAWQRRIEPVWKRIAGNCHLTRPTGETIRDAGFVVQQETRESMRKAMPWFRPSIRGLARKPSISSS